MELQSGQIKGLSLFIAPLVTSSILAASPSLAATFASSEGGFQLDNLSHSPMAVSTLAEAKSVALAPNSQVTAEAEAAALFIDVPDAPSPVAGNENRSVVFGEGSNYLGLAESFSAVIAYDFVIEADELFSFDFSTFLGLETSIDSPKFERASASGEVTFEIYDSTDTDNLRLLDFFTFSGTIATPGSADFIDFTNSANVEIAGATSSTVFGGTEESAFAEVEGEYSRHFDSLTYLTLVESKTNQAVVQTPESSSLVGLLAFGLALVGYGLKKKVLA
jgi:hypothetical protein